MTKRNMLHSKICFNFISSIYILVPGKVSLNKMSRDIKVRT